MKNARPKLEEKTKVPEGSFQEEVLEALSDFTEALKEGEVVQRYTCRQIKLNLEPTLYDSVLVRKTRRCLKLSQALFARFLGVSTRAVRSWEQGINQPQPIACRFMDEIRRNPKYWKKRLLDSSVLKDCEKSPCDW